MQLLSRVSFFPACRMLSWWVGSPWSASSRSRGVPHPGCCGCRRGPWCESRQCVPVCYGCQWHRAIIGLFGTASFCLKTGAIQAFFHCEGRSPVSIDWLKIAVRAGPTSVARLRRTRAGTSSGAETFRGLRSLSRFSTPWGVNPGA